MSPQTPHEDICPIYRYRATAATLYARLREKSTKFALHITKRMLTMAELYVADGAFDRLKKRFIRQPIKNDGELDHSTLLRSLRIDAQLFKKVADTLEKCHEITHDVLSNGKNGYILRKDN